MERLPNRKPNRLPCYDYSSIGAYFITICVQDMRCILSTVESDGTPESAYSALSAFGESVNRVLLDINTHYHNIRLDHFVIMPNHVHLLISITDADSGGAPRTSPPTETGAPRTSPPTNTLSSFIGGFKKFSEKACGIKIWQRGFHDHIIRSDDDYRRHWQYIDENPKKWVIGKDAYYGFGPL